MLIFLRLTIHPLLHQDHRRGDQECTHARRDPYSSVRCTLIFGRHFSNVKDISCRLSLSPDQTRALVTNTSGGLIIYDLPSAHVIACARGVQGLGRDSPAVFTHGGCTILVGCKDGQAKLFDSSSALFLQTLHHEGS